jgi:hypothetical protein
MRLTVKNVGVLILLRDAVQQRSYQQSRMNGPSHSYNDLQFLTLIPQTQGS